LIAETFAPARYRPMPSIAYRLALAAGGDASVGSSLKGAGDWDYAGGQALLRGTGADLYNEHGEPAAYSPRGESRSRVCLGTSPRVAREILTRPFREIYRAHHRHDPTGLMPPRPSLQPGHHVADPSLLRRAHGCLFGQLAGDALGSAVEFLSAPDIHQRYPNGLRNFVDGGRYKTIAGQPTDDSELALMLARTIERAGGYDAELAARAYGYWLQSGPFDVGSTTARALGAIPSVVLPLVARSSALHHGGITGRYAADAARHAADHVSQSNGSLMRISPLGIWGHAMDSNMLANLARADSELTHPNEVCQEACAVYVVAIAHAIHSGSSPEETFQFAREWAALQCRAPSVFHALTAAEHSPPTDYVTNQSLVLIALQNAFYQLIHAESAEDGIVATVMSGGDTDTNAAIAGALLGAVHGRESLPARWRNLILTCRPIAGAPGVHRPRPEPFWPVDALELSERLLLAGR